MKKIILSLLLSLHCTFVSAENTLVFGIVPQQSASKLAQLWNPIFEEISRETGLNVQFATAPDIPTFEKRLALGEYDIAYMNPYHYVVFNKSGGYKALAKVKDKQLKGIIVVAKNSAFKTFDDLNNTTIAFPAPAAFAASIITQSDLAKRNVNFTAKYVSSHDSVYRTVVKGIYPAGGGVLRTLNTIPKEIRDQLTVLWTTKGYTPHAIATHPRVTEDDAQKIQLALTAMGNNAQGQKLLNRIKIKEFENASDSDWDDIRELNLSQLSY